MLVRKKCPDCDCGFIAHRESGVNLYALCHCDLGVVWENEPDSLDEALHADAMEQTLRELSEKLKVGQEKLRQNLAKLEKDILDI